MNDRYSWPFYIGSKRGKLQSCLTRPVVTLFSLKVAWSGKSLIGLFLYTYLQWLPKITVQSAAASWILDMLAGHRELVL